MRFEGYDDGVLDTEEVIDEFLGDNPRARELRLMRTALEQRVTVMRGEYDRALNEPLRQQLQHRIVELHKQIAAIRQEEAITTFVEGSVRATLQKSALEDMV